MRLLFGLASAALALAAPVAAQRPASVIPIALYSYGYTPSPIVLRAGVPVTLQFTNRSGKGHSFKAQAFFATSRIVKGAVHEGELHLKGGQSVSVTMVPRRGTYPVHCSHFMHDQMGMHTTLYVQ
ncbi:MAG TPA: cupredoxin domain-containing protein [Sphingomicrobium sp.]|nr:cupredoxin domain-containing protein [Sphingomicrobium sp.]